MERITDTDVMNVCRKEYDVFISSLSNIESVEPVDLPRISLYAMIRIARTASSLRKEMVGLFKPVDEAYDDLVLAYKENTSHHLVLDFGKSILDTIEHRWSKVVLC